MASKRIAGSTINWALCEERALRQRLDSLLVFKGKSHEYLRRVLAQPEAPPKIDWNYYKSNIAVAGLVENFQKSYETLKVPYPPDTRSHEIDEEEKKLKKEVAEYIALQDSEIQSCNKELDAIESRPPLLEMTQDEVAEHYPDLSVGREDNPTCWPHIRSEQVAYLDEGEAKKH